MPPPVDVETEQPFTATMVTDRGEIVFELWTADAPCTVNNLRSLAHFRYLDGTPCHRLVTAVVHALHCGDPTGTGTEGPGYTFPDDIARAGASPPGDGRPAADVVVQTLRTRPTA